MSSGIVDDIWLAARLRVYSCCCCCEPEFDLAQLDSRNDVVDLLNTLGIRVPSPLAWGRNSVRELLRAEAARAMVAVDRF